MNQIETNRKEKNRLENPVIICALALVCCLLWGSAFPCIKIGYRLFTIDSKDVGSQILFAGIRFTLAGLLTVLFLSAKKRSPAVPKRSSIVRRILPLAFAQTVVQYFFFYVGLANASGVKASVIEASNVFLALLAAALLFHKEKLTVRKMAGCLVGFAGILLINMAGGSLAGKMSLTGEGFVLFSAASYALSSGLIKNFSKYDDPAVLSGWQFIVGGCILSLVGMALGGRFLVPTAGSALLLLYMALISAIAYTLWSLLLKHNPVGKVAIYGFMNPIFGVILSALLLGEQNQAFTRTGLVSLVLVCIGILIVNTDHS